ncbi:MAG: chitobiase/beta-hexosaminidase C-terminal domain-containing protein [Cyclobacteriaceae bacterium]|nr:chitobiase/beta-hexosaminidase C-terminal domain-containing protein [Cyclobacteriaceae bacterium]
MGSSSQKAFISHLIVGLSIILIFLTFFENYLQIPELLLFFGRLHPLILHFPIVLVLLTVINSFTKNKHHQQVLLPVTVLVTLVTAISGFLLSEENATKGDLLSSHQWMGSGVAIMAAIWYGIDGLKLNNRAFSLFIRISTVMLIIITGHYGGMVTHGRDFLAWNRGKTEITVNVPEDPAVFEHLILPVFETKCISCHNEDKSKGGLVLENFATLLKGGKSGPSVKPGEPGQGEMMRRIQLPLSDEDHMPPPDHKQLDDSEISLLEGWIARGSLENMRASAVDAADPYHATLQAFLAVDTHTIWQDLPEIDESVIEELSSDYYTLRRMAENSNGLSVMVLPHQEYTTHRLSHLQPVIENIVELDLSFLPLNEEEINFISRCKSLEGLEIDFTPVDDEKFNRLEDLGNLRILKAQGSRLTGKSLEKILNFKNLEKLFLWDTGIAEEDLKQIQNGNPLLEINTGIDKSITFTSILPVPRVKPEQNFFTDPIELEFELPLKGIDIFYTLEEKNPETEGTLFSKPILIDRSCKIRFMASREGWENSVADSILLFKTYRKPDFARLQYPPDPKYAGKGEKSFFDLIKGPLIPQDSAWLGFQENTMELHCQWDEEVKLRNVTLSSFVNTGIHVFPPSRIEVSGGNKHEKKRLGVYTATSVKNNEPSGFRYFSCPINPEPFTHLVITVTPLERLPEWHEAKGKPGWFFVDEVILEE